MRFKDNYENVVAVVEMVSGNESVGSEWIETKIFNKGQAIFEVIKWAESTGCSGRLIITIPDSGVKS